MPRILLTIFYFPYIKRVNKLIGKDNMGLIIKIPLLFLNKEKSWIHSIKTIRLDSKGSNVD
ncbi:hypothetical protein BCD96_002040 [Clostridium beijerinckii]|nr:hypothetical protein [Clostridium beijerinckii]NRT45856.1 hypothetical protein [Clostridium beijerinckii]NRU39575.1 hypothetical protein [Clostridium beijerinckii]NRZ20143.1 hypothetical protein [Clostridium beijerinckii]NSA97147.1 hypothetical protein [Clostridium beijerinckii]